MPKRAARRRVKHLTAAQRGDLRHRAYLVGPGRPFRTEEQRRQAWEDHREELEARCNPGTHCGAYWNYDAEPEPPGEDPRRILWETIVEEDECMR